MAKVFLRGWRFKEASSSRWKSNSQEVMQASFVEIAHDFPSKNHRLSRAGRRSGHGTDHDFQTAVTGYLEPETTLALAVAIEVCSR
jgi:hypothetical protein